MTYNKQRHHEFCVNMKFPVDDNRFHTIVDVDGARTYVYSNKVWVQVSDKLNTIKPPRENEKSQIAS